MQLTCSTLPEAIYSLDFPPYDDLERCIYWSVRYDRACELHMAFGTEDGQAYKSLKAIFESKADPVVVKLEGQKLSGYYNDLRDSPASEYVPPAEMQAAYHVYKAWLTHAALIKTFVPKEPWSGAAGALIQLVEEPILMGWDGIGDWHLRNHLAPYPRY